jgi:hypothetical protein
MVIRKRNRLLQAPASSACYKHLLHSPSHVLVPSNSSMPSEKQSCCLHQLGNTKHAVTQTFPQVLMQLAASVSVSAGASPFAQCKTFPLHRNFAHDVCQHAIGQ